MEEKQNAPQAQNTERPGANIPNGIMPEMPAGAPPQGVPPTGAPQGMPPTGMPPHGRRGKRGMPPHGMGPKQEVILGVEEREEMLAIMPDFKRWQSVFLNLYIAVVGVSIVVKLLIYAYLHFYIKSPDTGVSYFVSSVIVPLVINIIIFVIGKVIMSRMHEMDMRKNFIPVFMMELLNYVMCLVPRHIFFVMMIGFTVPICMTTIFSHKKMCSLITRISQVGIILSSVKQIVFTMNDQSALASLPAEQSNALWLIPQAVIIFAITTIIGIVAQATLGMTEGQRQKLLDYTRSIKEAQKRAEAANMAKSAFLANMSHEIRTPINAILGMNEMILRENTNKQIEDYARNIQSAGTSLLYQVNDVLDISKIESGKLEIVENNYDVSSFIHDCYNMIADRAKQKGLDLSIECNENIPSQMRGDEIRLRQIVTNLLSNACKYTSKGGITFTVGGAKEDDKFTLVISVKDTGIGIKDENIEKLFDQFTRFDLDKNRNIEGTGLGLAITKRLVDLMHGEITVKSIYGMGSLFTVTIPQQIIDETPMGDYNTRYNEAVAKNAKQSQNLRAPNAKILVVDDVEMNLKVIVGLLKKTEIQVDTALSGKLCLEKTEATKYDIIFMDHMMPEMDGVETYYAIKNSPNPLNKETPVIMLTANAITGVKEKFLQEGFADYLSKPVNSDKLEEMLAKHLPKDKVVMENADVSGDDKIGQNASPLKRFWQAYPKVDLNTGLSYCGNDSEIYIDAIKSFGNAAKIEEIKTLYEQKDAKNYQILVHGVKSSSLGIGLAELSEKAKALEGAAREEDWAFINAHHAEFISDYQTAIDATKNV